MTPAGPFAILRLRHTPGSETVNPSKTKASAFSTTALSLEFTGTVAPMNKAYLTATDVDELMLSLARLRATIAPEVPVELPSGSHPPTAVDPRWNMSVFQDGTKAIAVRHIGFGWVTLLFSKEEAERLGRSLLGQELPQFSQISPTVRPH